jgi:predicted nucleic-acid-binding protein
MLGIDTNVVIRLVVADDAEQTRCARKLVEQALSREEPVIISLLVLLESEWVLRSRYGFGREALFHWKDSASGFSDCLIAAHYRHME